MNSEPTLTQAIIFSDSVIREHGTGKCSYIGSFQRYTLPRFPFGAPPFFISTFLTNLSAVNQLNVTARIENSKTGVVLTNASVGVGFGKPPNRTDIFEIALPCGGFMIPAPDLYKVVILVNNEKVGERDLPAIHITSSPEPSTPQP
jgi:hypothetical protein